MNDVFYCTYIGNKGRARSSSYGAQNHAVAVVNLTAPASDVRGSVDDGAQRPDLPPDEDDEEGDPTLDAIRNIVQSSENSAFDSGDINAAVDSMDISFTATAAVVDNSGDNNAAVAEIDKDVADIDREVFAMDGDINADGNGDNSAAIMRNISIDSGDTNAAIVDIDTTAATVTVDSIDCDPDLLDRSGDGNAAVAHRVPAIVDSGIDNAAEVDNVFVQGDDGDDNIMEVVDTPSAAAAADGYAEDNAEETIIVPVVPDISGTTGRVVVDANSDYVSAYDAVVMVYSFKGSRAVVAQGGGLLCKVDSAVPDDVATSVQVPSSHTSVTTAMPTAMPIFDELQAPLPDTNDSLNDGAGSMPLIVSSEPEKQQEIENLQVEVEVEEDNSEATYP